MKEALEAELAKRQARGSLLGWCQHTLAPLHQEPARHHRLLIDKLNAVMRGEIDRLMVLMPPGSAKSTYASTLFPPYWFIQHPASALIAASHTAELAEKFGRAVRNLIQREGEALGYRLSSDSQAAGRWGTSNGGEYFAAGVGGPITGRRADLALIDDPVKSRQDAESADQREKVWGWYRAELYPRLKPGGRVVLIMTRWHEDDLGGRLLKAMDDGGDHWHVVNLPAFAGENDPLGREPGEVLWPEYETAEVVSRKRAAIGEREFSALYQQNPLPPEGAIFKPAMISVVDAAHHSGEVVRAWDLAATAPKGSNSPDWTVGLKMARYGNGALTVLDIVRLRGGPDEVEATIRRTAEQDGYNVTVSIPEDPGQAGKVQSLYLTRALTGFRVEATRETGDKGTRASPVASQVNVGNLSIVRAAWNRSFLDELASFPSGTHDDQVDALSRAFAKLMPDSMRTWLRLGRD